jgi:hypothetical protein
MFKYFVKVGIVLPIPVPRPVLSLQAPPKSNLATILTQPKTSHQTCNGLARKYFSMFSQIGMPSRSPAIDNDGFRVTASTDPTAKQYQQDRNSLLVA